MTTTMVIICCAVAVFVGFGLAFLFKQKNDKQLPMSDSDKRLAEAKMVSLKSEKVNLQKQLAALESEKNDLQAKLSNLEKNGNATPSKAQQEQIDSLKSEKDDLKKKLSALEKEKIELDKSLQNALNGKVDANASEEIKKLKKKISDLEEEKEDLEDDFNDKLKKEKRKLEEQRAQLEDDLKKSRKDLEVANEQVVSLQIDLEDAEKSANLKKKSLAFVKEVLTASPTSSSDMNKLYDLIDDIKDIIVDQLVPWSIRWMQRPEDKSQEYTDMELFCHYGAYNWEAISRKKWLANKTAIAFVGEFSAGKTSIVNRILSVNLPVSTKATTAIPTYISGGSIEKFQVVSPDNVVKNMPKKTFEKINKEVLDEVDGVSAMLKYFVMEYPNNNLQNLSILDTPGFNSNDQEDAQRTIDVINECDALFWVFDVNAGTVNKSSIKLIKENLQKPLYVIINKVDTKSNYDVNQVENLIKRTLSDNGIDVKQYIRFSQRETPSTLMNVIKSVPRSNNTSGYLDEVKQWVDELVKLCDDACKESITQCNASEKHVDELFNNISNVVDNVMRDCEDASGYGRFEEKWFRDDVYEFSKYEFNSLHSKLVAINNGVVNLWNDNFLPYKNAVIDTLRLYDDKETAESRMNQIAEIRDNLNKKIAELKKLK